MNKDLILKTIEQLVAVKSLASDLKSLHAVLDIVKGQFKNIEGLFLTEFEHGQKPSLLVANSQEKTLDVLFLAHLDVVDGAQELFSLRQEEGKIYGRGVCDMKGEAAILIEVFNSVLPLAKNKNIGYLFVTDEEVGGYNGVKSFLENQNYTAGVVINPDGGEKINQVVVKNKGVIHAQLKATGVAAHGSRPWLGHNAIDELISAYTRLRKMFPESKEESSWFNTINAGVIGGGKAVNLIADQALLELDIRYIPEADPEQLLQDMRDAVAPCTLEVISHSTPVAVNTSSYYMHELGESMKAVTGQELDFVSSHGTNDGRYFAEKGVPVIVSRPDSGGQHSDEEWMSINSLENFYHIYYNLVSKILTNSS